MRVCLGSAILKSAFFVVEVFQGLNHRMGRFADRVKGERWETIATFCLKFPTDWAVGMLPIAADRIERAGMADRTVVAGLRVVTGLLNIERAVAEFVEKTMMNGEVLRMMRECQGNTFWMREAVQYVVAALENGGLKGRVMEEIVMPLVGEIERCNSVLREAVYTIGRRVGKKVEEDQEFAKVAAACGRISGRTK